MESKNLCAVVVAATMMLAGVAASASPLASAHTCEGYTGCDADGCKDGEDHKHTDKNWVGEDEYCESHAVTEDPDACEYNNIEFPPIVCRLIEDDGAGGCVDARWTVPGHGSWESLCVPVTA